MKQDAYRPDIDGLRAVAIGLVLAFHAFPAALPGGFIGVDVFFVISGYLITGIIRDQKERGTFSLAHFYERRLRRIFPALIIVLLATYAIGWRVLLPSEFAQLGTNTIAGAAFFANIALQLQSGYFDIEAAKKPLLHLWSLGIEEQFYIAWPLLLLVAGRFRNGALRLIAAVGLVSFAVNVSMVHAHPEATFYLPITRAWELLAGAFLTYSRLQARRWANPLALTGGAMILLAAFALSPKTAFPGWPALLPVLGTAAVIASPSSIINRRMLSSSPFVSVGLISYPLYLWHWPLLVYATAVASPLNDTKRAAVLVFALVLSWVTYRLVENPIRRGGFGERKALSLGFGMACMAGLGLWTVAEEGISSRFPQEIRDILSASQQIDRWSRNHCLAMNEDSGFAPDCTEKAHRPLLFVWGDSTSAALMPGLLDLKQKREFGLAQYSISACEPSVRPIGSQHCADINRIALAALDAAKPDILLLHAIWYPDNEHLDALAATIEQAQKIGVPRIIVLGRVPVWGGGLKQHILNYYMIHRTLPIRLPQSVKEKWFDRVMREKLAPYGVTFISAWDALCNPEGCLVRVPTPKGTMDITATDILHLTEAGSDYLITAIQKDLFGQGMISGEAEGFRGGPGKL
jgi:peptidoglycan/LPS O-acetylase OafA/YrhL